MKFKIRVKSIWEYGQRKDAMGQPHQEDALFPAYQTENDSDRLFILCDGMGGHAKGEVASNTVCQEMAKTVTAECPDPEGSFSDVILQHALINAFKGLDARDTGGEKKMGTTMTFLKLHDGGYTAAHIGDSRIYQFRPGENEDSTEIIFKSEDHSLVNDLIKIGELTEEDAKTFPQRNVITRAMQPHDERRPKADVHHSTDIRPGDYFYLCSDGMLEQADDGNLRFIFSRQLPGIDKKVETLLQTSALNSDNHTGIIIEIVDVEGAPAAPAPCNPGECSLLIDKDFEIANRQTQPVIAPSMNAPMADVSRPVYAPSTAGAPNPQRDMNMASQQQSRKGKTGILVYLLVGLLIVLIALIAFLFLNKNKETTSKDKEPEEYEAPAPAPKYDAPTIDRTVKTTQPTHDNYDRNEQPERKYNPTNTHPNTHIDLNKIQKRSGQVGGNKPQKDVKQTPTTVTGSAASSSSNTSSSNNENTNPKKKNSLKNLNLNKKTE